MCFCSSANRRNAIAFAFLFFMWPTFSQIPQQQPAYLKAEYFSGVDSGRGLISTRLDRHIDFDWNAASPVEGVSDKSFSVRWTGFITAPTTGVIDFGFSLAHCSTCDDAESVKVWIDGKPVEDFTHAPTRGRRAPTTRFEVTFHDVKPHPLRIEYAHDSPHFGAGRTFHWKPPVAALREQAVAAAERSDVVIAFLGLSPEIEGEEMPVHVQGFDGVIAGQSNFRRCSKNSLPRCLLLESGCSRSDERRCAGSAERRAESGCGS